MGTNATTRSIDFFCGRSQGDERRTIRAIEGAPRGAYRHLQRSLRTRLNEVRAHSHDGKAFEALDAADASASDLEQYFGAALAELVAQALQQVGQAKRRFVGRVRGAPAACRPSPVGIVGLVRQDAGIHHATARIRSMISFHGAAPQKLTSHTAFRVGVTDVLAAPGVLRAAGVTPLDFDGRPTDQPIVFVWMPAASVFFHDPDGHLLEYIDAPARATACRRDLAVAIVGTDASTRATSRLTSVPPGRLRRRPVTRCPTMSDPELLITTDQHQKKCSIWKTESTSSIEPRLPSQAPSSWRPSAASLYWRYTHG
jgi:hypothetical protein